MAIRKAYEPIDIHKPKPDAWPDVVPPLTDRAAINAARRLWRFSVGTRFIGTVRITSGNRAAARIGWSGSTREIAINPSRGWRAVIHDLSHWFDYLVNGEMKHSKHHARFEAKLIREVIKRGWLNEEPEANKPALKLVPTLQQRQREKLERIEARMVAWEKKWKRAERALAKLKKQKRYYDKALAKADEAA